LDEGWPSQLASHAIYRTLWIKIKSKGCSGSYIRKPGILNMPAIGDLFDMFDFEDVNNQR